MERLGHLKDEQGGSASSDKSVSAEQVPNSLSSGFRLPSALSLLQPGSPFWIMERCQPGWYLSMLRARARESLNGNHSANTQALGSHHHQPSATPTPTSTIGLKSHCQKKSDDGEKWEDQVLEKVLGQMREELLLAIIRDTKDPRAALLTHGQVSRQTGMVGIGGQRT